MCLSAQVAAQEGKYLGQRLSEMPTWYTESSMLNSAKKKLMELSGGSRLDKPFGYMHMGSLAYVGSVPVRLPVRVAVDARRRLERRLRLAARD